MDPTAEVPQQQTLALLSPQHITSRTSACLTTRTRQNHPPAIPRPSQSLAPQKAPIQQPDHLATKFRNLLPALNSGLRPTTTSQAATAILLRAHLSLPQRLQSDVLLADAPSGQRRLQAHRFNTRVAKYRCCCLDAYVLQDKRLLKGSTLCSTAIIRSTSANQERLTIVHHNKASRRPEGVLLCNG